jgi:ELWxxDGT repeat protein
MYTFTPKQPQMIKNLLSFFAIFCALTLSAQPGLVIDYNTGTEDAFDCFLCTEQQTARVRTGVVTVATSESTGAEPCLLIEGQFALLKDINPGAEDSGVKFLTSRNGFAYFAAKDPVNGGAVWVSDGSEAGTIVFYDPDPANTSASITAMEFGADGALYLTLGTTLYRFSEGVGSQLATSVTLSTDRDNFPGGSITPYNEGIAYVANGSEEFTGGVFYATDTVRRLAFIPGQRSFDQAFAPREVNGNLVFSLEASLSSPERRSSYVYDAAADSLRRYLNDDGESLFVERWYEISDSLRIGRVQKDINTDDYYTFDGINEPVKLFGEGRFSLAARQTAPAVRVGDTLIWQTEGGVFNDIAIKMTDGTEAGTSTIYESTSAESVSNLLHAGGYVFFIATLSSSRGPLDFYRYELATGELVNFYSTPELAVPSARYSLQLLDVQDSELYFAGDVEPDLGRELYRINTGVEVVSAPNPRTAPALEVTLTSENFTVNAQGAGMANVTVFDLNGRLLSRTTANLNAATPIDRYAGIRIYVFEYAGKVAVRRVLGR